MNEDARYEARVGKTGGSKRQEARLEWWYAVKRIGISMLEACALNLVIMLDVNLTFETRS